MNAIVQDRPVAAASTPKAPTIEARATGGLTAGQLRTVLEAVTGRIALLNNMLMLLQESSNIAYEMSVMIDAAQIVATSIGAMADDALGGEILGDADRWNYGPNFHSDNTEGGAA